MCTRRERDSDDDDYDEKEYAAVQNRISDIVNQPYDSDQEDDEEEFGGPVIEHYDPSDPDSVYNSGLDRHSDDLVDTALWQSRHDIAQENRNRRIRQDENEKEEQKEAPSRKRTRPGDTKIPQGYASSTKKPKKGTKKKNNKRKADDDDVDYVRPKRSKVTPGEVLALEEANPGIYQLDLERMRVHDQEMKEYEANVTRANRLRRERAQREPGDYVLLDRGLIDRYEQGGSIFVHGLKKKHIKAWIEGRGVRFHGDNLSAVQSQHHHQVLALDKEMHKKALSAIKNRTNVHIKMGRQHLVHNIMNGGGLFSSFGDFVSGVTDFGKKAINVVSKYVLPIASSVLSLLPDSHPYIIAAKKGIQIASGIANQLDELVNKREEEEVKVIEREAEVVEKQLEAKEKGLSPAAKEKLLSAAAAAKTRLAEAKKKAAALKKQESELKVKQKAADAKVKADAAKIEKEAKKKR